MCLRVDQNRTITEHAAMEACNMALPTNISSLGYNAKLLLDAVDTNSDNRITNSELEAHIDSLDICCGSSCPRKSSCFADRQVNYIPLNQSYITADAFIEKVVASEDTILVPRCYRKLSVERRGANLDAVPPTFFMSSTQGVISLKEQSSNDTLYPVESMAGTHGIQMHNDDYDILRKEIGDKYAQNASSDHVYVVISASYAEYNLKFIYTNHPVFLWIEPALLRLLSFGILFP